MIVLRIREFSSKAQKKRREKFDIDFANKYLKKSIDYDLSGESRDYNDFKNGLYGHIKGLPEEEARKAYIKHTGRRANYGVDDVYKFTGRARHGEGFYGSDGLGFGASGLKRKKEYEKYLTKEQRLDNINAVDRGLNFNDRINGRAQQINGKTKKVDYQSTMPEYTLKGYNKYYIRENKFHRANVKRAMKNKAIMERNKMIKKIAIPAIIATGIGIGGYKLYKNRKNNSTKKQ